MESFTKAVTLTVPIVIGTIMLVIGIMSYYEGNYTQVVITGIVFTICVVFAIQQLWEITHGQ